MRRWASLSLGSALFEGNLDCSSLIFIERVFRNFSCLAFDAEKYVPNCFFRRNFEWFAFSLDSGTSFIGVLMATESKPGDESGLPFEDPLQVPSDQKETIKMASDEHAEISLQSGEDNLGPANQASLDELMAYLQKGLNSLKGLDLNGFQQIYPVFLSIFWRCDCCTDFGDCVKYSAFNKSLAFDWRFAWWGFGAVWVGHCDPLCIV